MSKQKKPKTHINFVHINDIKFNIASTHKDRKKAYSKGYRKHKTTHQNDSGFFMSGILFFLTLTR